MRLHDCHTSPGTLFVVDDELPIQSLVKLARGIVGHVQQTDATGSGRVFGDNAAESDHGRQDSPNIEQTLHPLELGADGMSGATRDIS